VSGKLAKEIRQTKPFQSLEEEAFLNLGRTWEFLQKRTADLIKEFDLTSTQYNIEVTFVASAAPRQAIEVADQPSPNLSAAMRTGNSLFVSGLLPDAEGLKGDGAAQARDILRKLDAIVAKAGFARADVRDLLVYATDAEAGTAAAAVCREAFGAHVAISPVKAGLALEGARVEIMTYLERA